MRKGGHEADEIVTHDTKFDEQLNTQIPTTYLPRLTRYIPKYLPA